MIRDMNTVECRRLAAALSSSSLLALVAAAALLPFSPALAGQPLAVLPTTSVSDLVRMREAWGAAPSSTVMAAAADDFAVLPTTTVADLVKMREGWGSGKPGAPVSAPLAAGSAARLPQDSVAVPAGPKGDPIVHAFAPTPVATLTPVAAGAIESSLKGLLSTRESWGKAPGSASAAASAAGASSGYAVLPTNSLSDLLAMRGTWGKAPAMKVAMAAVVPSQATGQSSELAVLPTTNVADLVKMREAWGVAPLVRTAAATAATPAAAATTYSAKGCEARLREAALTGAIQFESSSARIDAKSNATLDALVAVAKGCDKGRIRIEGHTDSSGRALKNKQLSASRAAAVADYLRKAGVPKNRLASVGVGQDKPLASNETPEGRAQNRRIEFKVIE